LLTIDRLHHFAEANFNLGGILYQLHQFCGIRLIVMIGIQNLRFKRFCGIGHHFRRHGVRQVYR
jgi:hypothetical protein